MPPTRSTPKRPLRILTNIRLYSVAGIAQYVSGFIAHNETSKDFELYGVDILRPDEQTLAPSRHAHFTNFRLIQHTVDYPPLGTVNQLSQGDLAVLRESFKDVIESYARAIRRVKPDIILINGSYFLPWCLLQAAKSYPKASLCMHYHGILKKEVIHWPNKIDRDLMLGMERDFDQKNIFYIFPSTLSKHAVEREVFGHKITHGIVLPNPVSPEFFATTPRRKNNSIGVVSRWAKIKNIDHVISVAKCNARATLPVHINIISDLRLAKDTKPFNGLLRFKKPMANKKLAQFYRRQGVMISPSTFETYGNVAQEAIASGTPALVSSAMGIAETFHKIGLSDWVINFDSPAKTLKKAKELSTIRVPKHIIAALHDECSSAKVYGQYAKLLSATRA